MTDLVAQLDLIHEAGVRILPAAAQTYESIRSAVVSVAPPSGTDFWESANGSAAAIIGEAGEKMQHAGNVLRLLAWELAEQDGVTAELLGKTGLDEVPELGSDGWSDEE
ncbi:hypothetical protein FB566_3069 [Stackebrandtia endophytica]|uniref:Uncharacterized protein n=1 Tax=Stackebrandtia endophytica TaxID=1496996 RepID=A0A543AYA5_9ACTN|nr:hypothetical protein [Stackebrandtia endophytica]TQL77510.1 hypothetical protein FB566_3069 [Stackebrandtia endophytica]